MTELELELEGVAHRRVTLPGGLTLHVAEAGSGPPVLLLHGWPQHWWMWRDVIPGLAQTRRVVVPDLRGLGWSDAPDADYRKSTLATDVLELMTELGIDTVPVIGHDWGAIVAQLMAVAAPTRVESVLSLSVPSMFRRGTDPRQLLGVAHMPVLSAPLAERAVPRIAASLLRLSRFSDEEAEPYLERLRDPARARASVAYYRTFLTREAPALLSSPPRRPDVPMRFMGGVGDPVCRYSPGIELVGKAGHFLPENRPEVVLEAARAQLAGA